MEGSLVYVLAVLSFNMRKSFFDEFNLATTVIYLRGKKPIVYTWFLSGKVAIKQEDSLYSCVSSLVTAAPSDPLVRGGNLWGRQ